jgi:hypothetical protein
MSKKLESDGLMRVRSVDPAILRQFKRQAFEEDLTHGQFFTKMFACYMLSKKRGKEEREEKEKVRIRMAPDGEGVGGRVLSEDERSSPERRRGASAEKSRARKPKA